MNLSCERVAQVELGEPRKKRGAESLWLCPNHDDRSPSLSVNRQKDAWLCGPCGKSGNAWEMAAFLAHRDPKDKPGVTAWLREHGLRSNNGRQITATYEYRDETGTLLYQTVRYSPKDFRQRRPDGKGGWVWNLEGVRLVPYRLSEWKNRDTVYIAEGEKDADALWAWGIPATCNPMGAGKWRVDYNQHFSGKQIVILPDNDPPGEAHARHVARNLLPVAKAVKILRLPGLPAKGDVSDWIASGWTQEKLTGLVKATPLVTAADVTAWKMPAEPVGVLLAEVKPGIVSWLWENRVPLGKITMLDGDPGLGKSLLTLEIAARVTTGETPAG